MSKNMVRYLLAVLFVIPSLHAAQCTGCLANGIWSEWVESAPCATTCGGCSNVTKTRTCLSEKMDCSCVGPTTLVAPCNTQACNYPRADARGVTCCIGSPMVINNWYHCATPETAASPAKCCDAGGYWSSWSTFTKVTDKIAWTRSRECLSGGIDCPCAGESVETVYSCPCEPIQLIKATDNVCASVPDLAGLIPFTVRDIVNNPSQCTMTFVLEATNFRGKFIFDNFVNDPQKATYTLATPVGVVGEDGVCKILYVHMNSQDTELPKATGVSGKREFTCDLPSLKYTANMFGKTVKLAQFYSNPTQAG